MPKENDYNKLKEDLETLAKDFKNIFGELKDTVKETIQDEVEAKKSEFETHFNKIKNKITEQASNSSTLQYIGIAFVVGVIAGALITKKKNE